MFSFIGFAGGSTLDRHVNVTTVLWYDDTLLQTTGDIGVAEVHHRRCVNVEENKDREIFFR